MVREKLLKAPVVHFTVENTDRVIKTLCVTQSSKAAMGVINPLNQGFPQLPEGVIFPLLHVIFLRRSIFFRMPCLHAMQIPPVLSAVAERIDAPHSRHATRAVILKKLCREMKSLP